MKTVLSLCTLKIKCTHMESPLLTFHSLSCSSFFWSGSNNFIRLILSFFPHFFLSIASHSNLCFFFGSVVATSTVKAIYMHCPFSFPNGFPDYFTIFFLFVIIQSHRNVALSSKVRHNSLRLCKPFSSIESVNRYPFVMLCVFFVFLSHERDDKHERQQNL